MNTLLSIIIPVYNAENHLNRTLGLLSEQIEKKQYNDTKIIIIDDASTDSSVSIIEQYKDKPFIIKEYFSNKIPTGEIRNEGLHLAKKLASKYVAFCDSDDLLDIEVARNMALKLESEECPVGIAQYQQVNYFDMNQIIGEKEGIYGCCDFGIKYIGKDILYSNIFMMTNAGVWNKVFNLSFLNTNDIYFAYTTYAEDVAFTYKVLCSTPSVYLYNELCYFYSSPDTNPGSNDKNSYNTWEELFLVMDEIWEYIKNKELSSPYKEQLYESFIIRAIGHIRYAQKKMKTETEKSMIASIGFEWLSEKQLELKKKYINRAY